VGYFHYRLLLMCGMCFMADAMEVSLLAFMATCAGYVRGQDRASSTSANIIDIFLYMLYKFINILVAVYLIYFELYIHTYIYNII
jgi:hypothetical protein